MYRAIMASKGRMRAIILLSAVAVYPALGESPTFYKDVLPLFEKRCVTCHRAGEAAPMSLDTYAAARPWAKSIRQAVLQRRMPPWHADPHFGKFRNDPSLTQEEIRTITSWVDGGAPAGPETEPRVTQKFAEGWRIAKPDVVFEMPEEFEAPAKGTIEYQNFSVPTRFTEDRWVEMAEVRPGNRKVVHHAIVVMSDGQNDGWPMYRQYLAGYSPGMSPQIWPAGQARLVKAGSWLTFQMHYTATGKTERDRTRIGLVFAKKPPQKQIVAMTAQNFYLALPPNQANIPVESLSRIYEDVELVAMRAHMHLRGKSFEFRAVFPNGDTQVLLRIPKFNFEWQPYYYLETPIRLPAGTRIECTAIYDNSRNNPANPDPNVEVRWGGQTWEEMMIGWFDVAIPADRAIQRRFRGD